MESESRRRIMLLFRIVFAVTLVLLLTITLWPHHSWPRLPIYGAKLRNCLLFAVLTLLSLIAFPRVKPLLIGELLSFLAAAIEVIQSLPIVDRNGNILDWLVETAVVALILLTASSPISRPPRRGE